MFLLWYYNIIYYCMLYYITLTARASIFKPACPHKANHVSSDSRNRARANLHVCWRIWIISPLPCRSCVTSQIFVWPVSLCMVVKSSAGFSDDHARIAFASRTRSPSGYSCFAAFFPLWQASSRHRAKALQTREAEAHNWRRTSGSMDPNKRNELQRATERKGRS